MQMSGEMRTNSLPSRLASMTKEEEPTGGGRRLGLELAQEAFDALPLALHLDDHALGGVKHPATEAVLAGKAIDEGAEPHSLHNAAHHHLRPHRHGNLHST